MMPSRRVRSMIMRTFLGATITSFLVFTMMVVVFGFSLEDEIFELQVRQAINNFDIETIEEVAGKGSLQALDMDYYIGMGAMPRWLRDGINPAQSDGTIEVFAEEHGHFHGQVKMLDDGRKLYVFFNARRFIRSTPHLKGFLVVVGGMALVGLIIALFFLARMSRKVSAPLEHMAAVLADGDTVEGRLAVPESAPRELHTLAAALEERDRRIQALLERERQFNRDASHELRTPLAVAFGAAEVLQEKEGESRALTRLMAAIKDMQQLTEGILWLGRDPDKAQACSGGQICQQTIQSYRHLVGTRPVEITFSGAADIMLPVPDPVAHVMVGNILRNALSYTDEGTVSIELQDGCLSILDTGPGFGEVENDRRGFGVGLSLVTRLCDHFGIEFSVHPRPEGGTVAQLIWSPTV